MPFKVHVIHGGMGRRLEWSGIISGRELIANNERILRTKSYLGVRWLLVDETATTSIDLSADEISTIKLQEDQIAAVLPELVRAVVVPHDLGFGMSRMWEMMTERPGWPTRVFRSVPEAEKWLREEVLRKFHLELPADLNAR